jgi:serine/threonine-protein kinase
VTRSGLIFDGRYRLEERIAAGGVGQVWRALDLLLDRPVAVKVLRPEYADHSETLDRFRNEARHAGAISHPGIAQVYDYGDWSAAGPPFLVLEFVDGPSLAGLLAAGPVDPELALDVIAQAAAGLHAAHRAGLAHRDVKPGNILIGPAGRVKITDFGIAYAAGQAPITGPGLVMGTCHYMAPERITGGAGGPASDLYALGIVLHECLTGMHPFGGSAAEVMAAHLYLPLPELPAGMPQELARFVARLTAKDPAQRLGDAGEAAAQAASLRDALRDGAIRRSPAPPPAGQAAAIPDGLGGGLLGDSGLEGGLLGDSGHAFPGDGAHVEPTAWAVRAEQQNAWAVRAEQQNAWAVRAEQQNAWAPASDGEAEPHDERTPAADRWIGTGPGNAWMPAADSEPDGTPRRDERTPATDVGPASSFRPRLGVVTTGPAAGGRHARDRRRTALVAAAAALLTGACLTWLLASGVLQGSQPADIAHGAPRSGGTADGGVPSSGASGAGGSGSAGQPGGYGGTGGTGGGASVSPGTPAGSASTSPSPRGSSQAPSSPPTGTPGPSASATPSGTASVSASGTPAPDPSPTPSGTGPSLPVPLPSVTLSL